MTLPETKKILMVALCFVFGATGFCVSENIVMLLIKPFNFVSCFS